MTRFRPITVLAAAIFTFAKPAAAEDRVRLSELSSHTHVHGLSVDRQDPQRLLIATHHGLFRAGPEGEAELVSVTQDFMGFNPHPNNPNVLFASGHPAGGGNLGFITSTDGGATWSQVSPGLNGPVDFHQMTVSPADPQRLYGAYDTLQVSRDGGRSWAQAGPRPDRLIDLAASAGNADILYAATEGGLLVSKDAGATWDAILQGAPVSMVEVGPDGPVYAFVLGRGLLRKSADAGDFETVNEDWGDRFILHLAVDPADPERMFAALQDSTILASTDGGVTWLPFGT